MFPSKALITWVVVSIAAVGASPLSRSTGKASLNFATRINSDGMLNILEKDRARAQAFRNGGDLGKRSNVNIANGEVQYTAQVGIGSPATTYTLLIDTGSSNTWVGANKEYVKTNSSVDTGNAFSVSYGTGKCAGTEYSDTVTLNPDLVIAKQSIGVATSSSNFGEGVDGILGVGPIDLTDGTVNNVGTVPTVIDNLAAQGRIREKVLGVYFVPASESNSGGTLTFGGVDDSVIRGAVTYVPLTTTSPASTYWGIDQSISYGGETILSKTAGIVDTGTTLILIATDAFDRYKSATGGTPDSATGLLSISSKQYQNLKTLSFHIGEKSYDLIPNAQIWPRSLNTAIGGSASSIYLVVSDAETKSGTGNDFTNGYTFLERFYSVYDTANGRVGFAKTSYTDSTRN